MHETPVDAWLERGRAMVLRGDRAGALAVFVEACAAHPESIELACALAGLQWQARQSSEAEARLRPLLARHPDSTAATFLLAKILREQGRMLGVEIAMRAWSAAGAAPIGERIQAIELLDDCDRKQAASDLAEQAIAQGSLDARLHAYAGMLAIQLGDFERARERYLFALANDARALDWQSAYGLASSKRFASGDDPDFELLRGFLRRPGLADAARASILFALGKASADIGDIPAAVTALREANALVGAGVDFQAKQWRRVVSSRLESKPLPPLNVARDDFAPIFIVGMPRSGTTLVAEWLARHPDVCNRGELNAIAQHAQELARAPGIGHGALVHAAHEYVQRVRQDDTSARWFVDKQPLNFLHLDLIAALFPNARIIHCMRNQRDTALSIWMQYFAGHAQDFAYDFANIAAVMSGCDRLIAAAAKRYPQRIRSVRYESFVADAGTLTRELAAWIGLPDCDWTTAPESRRVISTSSAWQARQPVHMRSVGRWQAYAPHLPELLRFDA
ncbi:tetratricopeptide repeat-containing sulfotransferase family protein [Dokdonella sp.]|uniref:tetratricopeptide repeat-containing sulfotransferase family protein n=1 Tax=Dokdonella sp. TaxID=2291710 RepID=UPI0037831840